MSRLFKPEQSWNMPDIFFTFDVSKLVRSISVSEEQPLNILYNEVTLEVLNELRLTDFSDEQLKNIPFILVTFLVSNELKSRFVSDEQPENIKLKSVALAVLKLPPRLMLVNDEQSQNI